jgi:predicted aspartyl protease
MSVEEDMSTFTVAIELGDPVGQRFESVDAWADTGGFYSSFPRPLLESLGVVPHKREVFMLADGRIAESDVGRTWIRIGDRSEITLVLFGEPDGPHVLGAYALEGLALAADPVNHRLVPMEYLPRFCSSLESERPVPARRVIARPA